MNDFLVSYLDSIDERLLEYLGIAFDNAHGLLRILFFERCRERRVEKLGLLLERGGHAWRNNLGRKA